MEETIHVPPGTPAGVYQCVVEFAINGVVFAVEQIIIEVQIPGNVEPPVVHATIESGDSLIVPKLITVPSPLPKSPLLLDAYWSAPGAAATAGVLILGPTVSGGAASLEAAAATLAGQAPTVVDAVTWGGMTAAQFAAYRAIVFGDPTCVGDPSPLAAAEANRGVWGPVVNGNVIIIGTDPVFHQGTGGAVTLINNGMKFAADAVDKTGAYIDLSCYYFSVSPAGEVAPAVPVAPPVLEPFGSFLVHGQIGGCPADAHIVAAHPALAGLTDADLSNWGCSVHEVFPSWPASFLVLAIARDLPPIYTAPDGSVGSPYILARGEALEVISDIKLAPKSDTNPVGTDHTVTATVLEDGAPKSGVTVTFKVVDGPHTGVSGTAVTLGDGTASFTYHGTTPGTDYIVASFVDAAGKTQSSNVATKIWTGPVKAVITYVPVGCAPLVVTFVPGSITTLPGSTVPMEETITVPPGTPPGVVECWVIYYVNGVEFFRQLLVIKIVGVPLQLTTKGQGTLFTEGGQLKTSFWARLSIDGEWGETSDGEITVWFRGQRLDGTVGSVRLVNFERLKGTFDGAKFCGVGKVDHHGGFKFCAEALDTGAPGSGNDQFGISIWRPDGSTWVKDGGQLALGDVKANPSLDPVKNGGFESCDLSRWNVKNSGSGDWTANGGFFDPPGPGGPVAPYNGNCSAVTWQNGPGVHTLWQKVHVPEWMPSAYLSWADRIENWAGVFSEHKQEFRVQIWDTEGGLLEEVFSTDPGDPVVNPWTLRVVDISAYIGRTIIIAFIEEDNLFYFNVHLDNVAITMEPPPLPVGGGDAGAGGGDAGAGGGDAGAGGGDAGGGGGGDAGGGGEAGGGSGSGDQYQTNQPQPTEEEKVEQGTQAVAEAVAEAKAIQQQLAGGGAISLPDEDDDEDTPRKRSRSR